MKWHQRFFWLLLLFLPTQLGYHFWPDWAGVLGRRVDYLAPTVYLTDVLLLLTVGSWFFSRNSPPPPLKIRGGFGGVIVVLLLFVIFNVGHASSPIVALYKWLKVLEFVALGWYIVRTRPKLSAISFPLAAGVFYSSVLAIVQFLLQHSIGGPLWWLGERTFDVGTPGIARMDWYGRELLRPYATFPHPNVLGGFLAAVMPLVVVRYLGNLRNLRKKIKLFYGTVILVGIIALLLTFSRSAIVVGGMAIVMAIARIKNYARPERGRRELGIMKNKRIVVLLLIGFFVLLPTSYFMIHNSTEESVVVRQQLNVAAIKLWAGAPLFGVGLGNFLVRLPEALPTRTIYFLQPVHNIYLLMLSEVGIVGVGLIVFFIVTLLNHESGIMKYGKDKTKFIIHTSLFIILVLGLVDHYPLMLQQGQLLLAVLAAMSMTSVH